MKRITFRKIRGILGVVVVVVSMVFVYAWETKGRESFLNTEVVVLNTDVQEGQKITNDMIDFISIDKNQIIENAISNGNFIINKAAKHYIPKGAQLTDKYFDDYEVIPGSDEYIFQIPNNWILAMPDTMRRKDTAYFYEISDTELSINNRQGDLGEDGVLNNSISSRELQQITSNKEPITSFTIAYVKDSSSQEVVSVGEERFNSSSKIVGLEVIADIDRIQLLEKCIQRRSKFIILYR